MFLRPVEAILSEVILPFVILRAQRIIHGFYSLNLFYDRNFFSFFTCPLHLHSLFLFFDESESIVQVRSSRLYPPLTIAVDMFCMQLYALYEK
jgi:hypothetical protein